MIIDFCTAQNGLQPATVWFYIRSRTYFLLADHFGPHHLAEPRRGTYADVSLDWLKIIVLFFFIVWPIRAEESHEEGNKNKKKLLKATCGTRFITFCLFSEDAKTDIFNRLGAERRTANDSCIYSLDYYALDDVSPLCWKQFHFFAFNFIFVESRPKFEGKLKRTNFPSIWFSFGLVTLLLFAWFVG